MDLLTMAQLDGQGCFEDAEENPQLEGAPPLTWTESAAARQAAEAARSLKERGDFGAAAEQYAAALSAGHPNRAACHGKRADCLGRVGRLEEALAEFERAVELAPTSGAHRYGKAYTLRMLGPPPACPPCPPALSCFAAAVVCSYQEGSVCWRRAGGRGARVRRGSRRARPQGSAGPARAAGPAATAQGRCASRRRGAGEPDAEGTGGGGGGPQR